MFNANGVHVNLKDNGCCVRKEMAKRNLKNFDTKEAAIGLARETTKRVWLELIIHKRNGQFVSRNSCGNDPFPPKG